MLVSIVMAVYNGEKCLEEAITSTLSQTYSNIEVVIINNGSTDSTKAILDEIKDERITVIHLEQNQGAAHALNIGIKQAKGLWIAINDADDFFFSNKIEEQVQYLNEHPELVGVGTLVECISKNPAISQEDLNNLTTYSNSFDTRWKIKDQIFYGNPVIHSSMMYSKDLFSKVGGYDTELEIAYDYDLWHKLSETGEIEKVPKVLLYYQVNPESLAHGDVFKTANEIQVASSKGIYRKLKKRHEQDKPKATVTGPTKACENYRSNIAPLCGLYVNKVIDCRWKYNIEKAITEVKEGKIDAIIVLYGYKSKRILRYLKSEGLILNTNIFRIYNILI